MCMCVCVRACLYARVCVCVLCVGIISYPLFADADTGIYPHAASQYHARPKAKRGIAMLSVDKFPCPRKQTRGNEFIPIRLYTSRLWTNQKRKSAPSMG